MRCYQIWWFIWQWHTFLSSWGQPMVALIALIHTIHTWGTPYHHTNWLFILQISIQQQSWALYFPRVCSFEQKLWYCCHAHEDFSSYQQPDPWINSKSLYSLISLILMAHAIKIRSYQILIHPVPVHPASIPLMMQTEISLAQPHWLHSQPQNMRQVSPSGHCHPPSRPRHHSPP
jgi:hypothetical protein